MLISILTFQGYNELDSFIAFGILNRIKKPDWRKYLLSRGICYLMEWPNG